MFRLFREFAGIFTRVEKWRLLGLLLAMLAAGVLQLAGVGIILPFVALLANPSSVHTSQLLNWCYVTLEFTSVNHFLLLVGVVLLVVLVCSNVFTATTSWVVMRFSWNVQRRISSKLLDRYLHQPYQTLLNRNSADLAKSILSESQHLAGSLLMPLLDALAFGITAVLIVAFLVWLQPWLALLVMMIFGGAYLLVYLIVRRALLSAGRKRMHSNSERFKAVNEALGGIKEVKLLHREDHFLKRYDAAAHTYARSQANGTLLEELPRYAIESVAFGIVMAVVLYLLYAGKDLVAVLPLASAFLVAGYRLLPALQHIYRGVSSVRLNWIVLETLRDDLLACRATEHQDEASGSINSHPLPFHECIEVQHLSYGYPGAKSSCLKNISLAIPCNEYVAFTGSTGAGKSTLADLLLGLLAPSSGNILVDGVPLTEKNLPQWQQNIGYVPQEIYLTDSSVASNIAFGLPDELVDKQAVERAARIANIHDFVVGGLPNGYDTPVGERGVRLSGGQRQRIGIARALYRDPSVIVLDEATSALDNETERHIVDELDAMRGERTLIVIAHRLSTVQKCHRIFLLKEGELVASGNYDELVATSEEFKKLVSVATSTTHTNH